MGILNGKVAIITGASSGVGRGCALRFAEEGANVIACARRTDKLEELKEAAAGMPGKIVTQKCNVGTESDLDNVVKTAVSQFGTIHILANIAQGGLDKQAYLSETTVENALLYYTTGPIASMLLMQKCLPYMKEQHYGRIINCASGAGVSGQAGFAGYAMAKGAILSLTRNAAREWGQYGIVTNVFLPVAKTDGFDTSDQGRAAAKAVEEQSPIRRFGLSYEDVSPMVAFLASEQAGYINGQTISICGGLLMLS